MVSPLAAVREHLDPGERLGEMLFGLIMVLTFTLGAGYVVRESGEATRELLVAALGCNVAWGLIDGVMILMDRLLERGRKARLARAVQEASSEEEALAAVAKGFDLPLVPGVSEADRAQLYRAIRSVAARARTDRVTLYRADVTAALAGGLLVFVTALPPILPFLFIDDRWLALRASNLLLLGLLCGIGASWAKHAGTPPVKTALSFLLFGAALVGAAILLGG